MRVKEKVKPIILLSISICLLANSLAAQIITGDKTIDGEYSVTENIIVTEGARLEIKPGSVLYFSPYTSIRVDGLLIADGTPESPISFILDPNESNGVWLGIHFTNKAELAEIQNCIFQNTGRLTNTKYGALSFSTDKIPEISGCTFSDVQAGAIVIQNFGSVGSIAINNNTIESFSPFAIAISSGTVRENIVFTENVIKDNGESLSQAIYLSYVISSDLEMNDNWFMNINGELNNSIGSGELIKVDQTNEINNIKVHGDKVTECFNLSSGYLLNSVSLSNFSQITVRDITSSKAFISINAIEVNLKNSQFSDISSVGLNGGGAFSVKFTSSNSPGKLIVDNAHFTNCDAWGSNNIAGAISISGEEISNVFIDQTSISLCQSMYGSGVNLSANSLGSFTFTNSQNIGGNTANSGGLLSIKVNGLIDEFFFSHNQVSSETSDSIVANISRGGLLLLEAASLNNFDFNNNTFGEISSKGHGGAIFLNIENALNQFVFNENHINNVTNLTDDELNNGGVIYLACPSIQSVIAQGNSINSIRSGNSGGFLYLNQSGSTSIGRIQVDSNTIDEVHINNGHGGLFALNSAAGANIIQTKDNSFKKVICNGYGGLVYLGNQGFYPSISIKSNIIENTLFTYGGGLIFSQGSTTNSKTSYNVVEVISNNTGASAIAYKGSGALVYLMGNYSPESSSFIIKSNISNSLIAEKSGGGIWFEGKIANKCTFELNQVKAITQSKTGNGGFLYLKSSTSDKNNDIFISRNNINSAIAKKSGGAFYIDQPLARDIVLSKNTIGSSHADLFGGVLYLDAAIIKGFTFSSNIIKESQALSGGTGYVRCIVESFVVSGNTIRQTSEGELVGFLEFKGEIGQISIVDNTFNLLKGNNTSGISLTGSISGKVDISNNQITEILGPTFGFIKIENRGDSPLHELNIVQNTIGSLNTGSSGFLFYEGHPNIEQISIISSTLSNNIINTGDHACFYIQTDGDIGILNYSNNTLDFANKLVDSKTAPTILQTISRELGSAKFLKNKGLGIINTDPSVSTLFGLSASDSIGTISIIEDDYKNFSLNQTGGIYTISSPSISSCSLTSGKYSNINTKSSGSILWIPDSEVNKLVIEKNSFEFNNSSLSGGCIYSTGKLNNVIISGNTFVGNTSLSSGGSIYITTSDHTSQINLINNIASGDLLSNAILGGLAYIEGFTSMNISETKAEKFRAMEDGGILYLDKNARVLIENSDWESSHALKGSAIYIKTSELEIKHNNFSRNYSNKGGLYISNSKSAHIYKCNFVGNISNGNSVFDGGSGLYIENSNYLLNRCEFLNSVAKQRGGGAMIKESSGKIINGLFKENQANEGGGIYFLAQNEREQIFEKNTLLRNHAELKGGAIKSENCKLISKQNHYAYNEAGQGGAIFLQGKSANTKIYNSLFYANTSNEEYGASCLQVNPVEANSSMRFYMINCTIDGWQNHAIILEKDLETFKILNSIIFGGDLFTQPINFNMKSLDISYSNIQYLNSDWLDSKYNNISVTPKYMDGSYMLGGGNSIDSGHPDENYNDMWFFPYGASKGSARNDIGASGGPNASYYSEFYKIEDFPYNDASFQVIEEGCHNLIFLIPFYQSSHEYKFTSNNSDTVIVSSNTFEVGFTNPGNTTGNLIAINKATDRIDAFYNLLFIVPGEPKPIDPPSICYPHGITGNTIIITQKMVDEGFYLKPCIIPDQDPDTKWDFSWEIYPADSYLRITSSGFFDAILELNEWPIEEQLFTISYSLSNTCGQVTSSTDYIIRPETSSSSGLFSELNTHFELRQEDNHEMFVYTFARTETQCTIEIINLTGQKLFSEDFTVVPGSYSKVIPVEFLDSGLYLLIIRGETVKFSKKFIKY